jgi:uncharacterized protein YndB with AHSA1/START domain
MLGTAIYIIILAVVAILIYASTRPDCFQVQRKIMIKAPPEKIFTFINDLHQWKLWSPWETKDPAMKRTFSSVTIGKDAVYAWEGNSDVGKGRMEITESNPPSRLTIKLDFIKPFEAHNIVEFMLVPKDEWTEVIWDMHGPMPFISKLMGVFISMDRMVGKDFEAGLRGLKAQAET